MHLSVVFNCWSICSVILPNVHPKSVVPLISDFKSEPITWSSLDAMNRGENQFLTQNFSKQKKSLTASIIDGTATFSAVVNGNTSISYMLRLSHFDATIKFRTVWIIGDGRCIIKVCRANALVAWMSRYFEFLAQMIHLVVFIALRQIGNLVFVCAKGQSQLR